MGTFSSCLLGTFFSSVFGRRILNVLVWIFVRGLARVFAKLLGLGQEKGVGSGQVSIADARIFARAFARGVKRIFRGLLGLG